MPRVQFLDGLRGLAIMLMLLFDRLARIPADSFVAQALFRDFPPWPWLSAALIGLVAGWVWLDARRRGPEQETRYFWTAAVLGALAVGAYFLYDWLAQTSPRLSFRRDFLLNRHWTPRGATLLWVGGMTSLLLAAAWLVMKVRKRRLRWLVVLGQTALMLYFLHQVIALTLVNEWLGWRFNDWPRYTTATVVLLALLVGVGKVWLVVRGRLRSTTRHGTSPVFTEGGVNMLTRLLAIGVAALAVPALAGAAAAQVVIDTPPGSSVTVAPGTTRATVQPPAQVVTTVPAQPVTIQGTVTEVDRDGEVTIRNANGDEFEIHVPPSTAATLRPGDAVRMDVSFLR